MDNPLTTIPTTATIRPPGIMDLAMREATIIGVKAPFVVWGMLFGSITWIVMFGIKK